MTLNRRDLLKTAAIAALPGSVLLGASPLRGEASPPEAVPEVTKPSDNASFDEVLEIAEKLDQLNPPMDWCHKLEVGNMIVFPAGISKIKIEARTVPLVIVKRGIVFNIFVGGQVTEFAGAKEGRNPKQDNMLRQGGFWKQDPRSHDGFDRETLEFLQRLGYGSERKTWDVEAISDERYNVLAAFTSLDAGSGKMRVYGSSPGSHHYSKFHFALMPIEEPHVS